MTKEELIKLGFNEQSLRLLLSWRAIKKLPIKYCKNKQPIYEAMKDWFFNPVCYYPTYSRYIKGECGCDNKFRYVLVKEQK